MSRREHYLELLGLDVWTLRRPELKRGGTDGGGQAASSAIAASEADAGAAGSTPETAPAMAVAGADEAIWEALRAEVSACRRCTLCEARTQTVFGVGNRRARLLVIGEAPGAEEDRRGEPFVGRAGQLLNSMLRAIGCPRESVYIANVLKCRPPGNRDPSPAEVASCLPYLQRQIELLAPRVVLVVGRIAAQNLLGTDMPISRLRGSVHRLGPRAIPLIVTYHPAYLLRSPGEKRRAWLDLKLARAELARAGGSPGAAADAAPGAGRVRLGGLTVPDGAYSA